MKNPIENHTFFVDITTNQLCYMINTLLCHNFQLSDSILPTITGIEIVNDNTPGNQKSQETQEWVTGYCVFIFMGTTPSPILTTTSVLLEDFFWVWCMECQYIH